MCIRDSSNTLTLRTWTLNSGGWEYSVLCIECTSTSDVVHLPTRCRIDIIMMGARMIVFMNKTFT